MRTINKLKAVALGLTTMVTVTAISLWDPLGMRGWFEKWHRSPWR